MSACNDPVACPVCAARKPDDGDWWARHVLKATDLAALKSIAEGWPMSRPGEDDVESARSVMDAAMAETHRLGSDPATRFTKQHGLATVREMQAIKAYRAALVGEMEKEPAP